MDLRQSQLERSNLPGGLDIYDREERENLQKTQWGLIRKDKNLHISTNPKLANLRDSTLDKSHIKIMDKMIEPTRQQNQLVPGKVKSPYLMPQQIPQQSKVKVDVSKMTEINPIKFSPLNLPEFKPKPISKIKNTKIDEINFQNDEDHLNREVLEDKQMLRLIQ